MLTKYKGIFVLLLVAFNVCFSNAGDRPNVIIFIADDISYNDFGCYGHPVIRTPNIDRLAANGMKFTNMFLTTSSCSPSRASVILGRYPHNTGAAELHTEIPAGQIPFPKVLRQAGYYTGQAGKWHFGPMKIKPGDAMEGVFDRIGGSVSEGGGESGAEKWEEYIQQRPKDKPFFMWFAAHDAHRDWDNDPLPVKYEAADVIIPAHLVDNEMTRRDLASYYGEVSRFDYWIGKAVGELERQGVLNNTVIMIMADNGRPFPGNKTRMYDEGIKTPFIIHWPDGIGKKGAVSKSLVSSIDIAPTILNIAGLKAPSHFQGQSFKKLLKNPDAKFRTYVFAEHNWHDFQAFERMVRTEKFLYIQNELPDLDNRGAIDVMGGGAGVALQNGLTGNSLTQLQKKPLLKPQPEFELYNCVADPQQNSNLYAQPEYIAEGKRLSDILKKWQHETGDSHPEHLTGDWYDRITNEPLREKGKRGVMPGSDKNATRNNNRGPF